MKLIFLGSGSAFTVGNNNYHSNMLLVSDSGKKLLIDCGSDARLSLYEQGFSYADITDVYISHLHADHAGGLEWLAFSNKFDSKSRKPKLHISDTLVTTLWNHVLRGGLCSLQDEVAELSSYFDVEAIKVDNRFSWEGIEFQLVQTLHICNGCHTVPSFGLFFRINTKWIFITTDTQFTPELLLPFYQQADVIFHDCETSKPASGVHAVYDELNTLDPSIKAKTWLYHYNPGPLPKAVHDGFAGFVKKGQMFEF
ncbi:MBL fold metallo-hydrolase [soil metagenome]